MKKIAISGYYGFGNVGDEAVLAGTLASFRQPDAEIDFTILSQNPARTTLEHGVRALSRNSPSAVIRAIKESDMLLSGGGSLLQDVTSARSAAYYFAVIGLAQLLSKPVAIYAQGIGPITRRITALQAHILLNRARLITVRDEDSAAVLRRLGVKQTVQVTADPSFALDPASDEETDVVLNEAGIPSGSRLLGVALRKWRVGEDWPVVLAEAITEAARILDARPVFLPMQYPDDLALADDIAARLPMGSSILRERPSSAIMKSVMGRMDVLLAMRLHALLFAAAQGTPSVALSYDPKVTSFARSAPGHLPVIEAHSPTRKEIVGAIDLVMANRESISAALREKEPEWRRDALRNSKLVMDLLAGN